MDFKGPVISFVIYQTHWSGAAVRYANTVSFCAMTPFSTLYAWNFKEILYIADL